MEIETISSDEELIEKIQEGETALFEIIMRRYNRRLYRVARAILNSESEAEDVMQESYVRAYQNLRQFSGHSRFATWLTKIAIHEALARKRKRSKLVQLEHMESQEGVIHLDSKSENPETRLAKIQLREVLESAVDALPDKYRLVFFLRQLEGLSTEETAEALNLGVEAIKTRLHRARKFLRKRIDVQARRTLSSLYGFKGERCDSVVRNVLQRIQTQ